jgi:hypothetical protein
VTVITKFYLRGRIPDKHDIDSSHLDITTSIIDRGVAKHGVQDPFTNAPLYFDITDSCNRYPFQHLLWASPREIFRWLNTWQSTKLKPILKIG